ncbi:MAG: peptidylprolyl isomerase [Clostridia bacterium]|nr:peptidylprolyl isomerase [Clostridia bacterium]
MKRFISLSLVFLFTALCLFGCTNDKDTGDTTASPNTAEHSKVLFTMENGDTFTVELYPEYAPATVANFLKLTNEGFYDGLTFHRVVDNFMAQGGDPEGNGMGGSDETIPGEFSSNGFASNTLSHTRGVISMARSNDPNSASSQFFICYTDDCAFLDGNYAAFGEVIEGMETVDAFLKVERTYGSDGAVSSPLTPIVIESAKVIG